MNKWIAAGTLLALTTGGVAMAQGAPPAPPADSPQAEAAAPEGGHHGPHGPWMRMGMHGHHGMGPGMSKAAFFRFRKGDAGVTIKCPDDEPVKACVDAATTLMDKLQPGK